MRGPVKVFGNLGMITLTDYVDILSFEIDGLKKQRTGLLRILGVVKRSRILLKTCRK